MNTSKCVFKCPHGWEAGRDYDRRDECDNCAEDEYWKCGDAYKEWFDERARCNVAKAVNGFIVLAKGFF